MSADKTIDLSTTDVFDQISGTKGLFWNGILGFEFDFLFGKEKLIWRLVGGISFFGESSNSKNELESSLSLLKLEGRGQWKINETIGLQLEALYSSIKGIRSTTYSSWIIGGFYYF